MLPLFGVVDLRNADEMEKLPGIYRKSGVRLSQDMMGFLRQLRSDVGFNIVVTNGMRTTAEQAKILIRSLEKNGDKAWDIYMQKDLVQELQHLNRWHGMQLVLDDQVGRGRYLSPHMRGDALDLRVNGYTVSEKERLKRAAEGLGVKVVDKTHGTGPHLHLQGVKRRAAVAATSVGDGGGGAGAGILLLGGVALLAAMMAG